MKQHRNDFAEYLKSRRKVIGLTQADIAARLGYTTAQFISNWERGISLPPANTFRILGKLLRTKASEIAFIVYNQRQLELRAEYETVLKRLGAAS